MTRSTQAAALPYGRRRGLLLDAISEAGADALLVTAPENVRYLTGFSGTTGWLVVASGEAVFLTDARYEEQAADQVADAEILVSATGLVDAAAAALASRRLGTVGYEPAHVTVATQKKLEDTCGVGWIEMTDAVEAVRRQKDDQEVEAIRRALRVSEAALEEVAPAIAPGMTEKQVAADIERACRYRGADGMAFETIVASGPRTALPHGVASDRVIGADEPVMIDMGCRLDGYCSDITRMVWCGDAPDPEWSALVEVVLAAQAAAIGALGPGVAGRDVDSAARRVIEDAGYGDSFVHGTGHGVGLEVHEAPALSKRGDAILEAGMVVTIEPAIYLQGRVGVRIEEMVCVSDSGPTRLTTLNPEPILARAP